MVGDASARGIGVDRRLGGIHLLSAATQEFAENTADYSGLLQAVARNVADGIGDVCVVLLLSEDKQSFDPLTAYDRDPEVARQVLGVLPRPLSVAQPTLTRDVTFNGQPVCLPALDLDELRHRTTPEGFELHRRLGTHGVLVVPLRVRGEPMGSLGIVRYRTGHAPLDAFDVELAGSFASLAALAISNAVLLRRAESEVVRREIAEAALVEAEKPRRAQEDLARANRVLDAIVENIPNMVFVKDAGRLAFTHLNRAGEELLGISRTELLGKTDRDLFPEVEADFFQAKDRQTLAEKLLVDIPEEPIQTRRGPRWLHTKKVPILDSDGTPLYLLGISDDITLRKRAESALREANEATELANRELDAFSYSVAHDLRAPLRSIDGYSQALLDEYDDVLDGPARTYLGRVRGSAQHMAELIDDLLSLSRTARAELRREHVDLTELAHATIDRLRRTEPDRRVAITVGEGLFVTGDPRLLAVVFDNLLDNAWKFTSKREDARIELGAAKTRDGRCTFFVRDNGAGFDMTYSDRLFRPFERLHSAAEFEGTGVGLAIVQRVVARHGGRVWAEGAVDGGATVYFTVADREPSP